MGSSNEDESVFSKEERASLIKGRNILLLLAGAILFFYFLNFFNSKLSQESVAQFGDYLGGVLNPILGFATVILLVWSIKLQLKELQLTRAEMIENTKANQDQADELNRQNHLLEDQHKMELSKLKVSQDELVETKEENQRQVESLTKQNDMYKRKEYRDEQLLLLNSLEEGIEKLFAKPIIVQIERRSVKTTLENSVFLINSDEAKLFREACLLTEQRKADYGCHLITRLLLQKLQQISICIRRNLSRNAFDYDLTLSKIVWFSDMLLAFTLAGAVPKKMAEEMNSLIIASITQSNYSDIEKKSLVAIIKDFDEHKINMH